MVSRVVLRVPCSISLKYDLFMQQDLASSSCEMANFFRLACMFFPILYRRCFSLFEVIIRTPLPTFVDYSQQKC
jgi:hypothetical protein